VLVVLCCPVNLGAGWLWPYPLREDDCQVIPSYGRPCSVCLVVTRSRLPRETIGAWPVNLPDSPEDSVWTHATPPLRSRLEPVRDRHVRVPAIWSWNLLRRCWPFKWPAPTLAPDFLNAIGQCNCYHSQRAPNVIGARSRPAARARAICPVTIRTSAPYSWLPPR
jgi:hypothetical protein